jgi:threonine aldolase
MSKQLASKTSFISGKLITMLDGNLWAENAGAANARAKQLEKGILEWSDYQITEEVQTNGVWVVMPPDHIEKLQKKFAFYRWENGIENEVRLMTSYMTTPEDVSALLSAITELHK